MKYSEFQMARGKWFCNDISNLRHWWYPARILHLSVKGFANLLHDKYHANLIMKNDTLIYSWDNYMDCHRFCLDFNKKYGR